MKKIKLVYNVLGTFGAVSNIVPAYTEEVINSITKNISPAWPYVTPHIFNVVDHKNNTQFEVTTPFNLGQDDYFLYETQWDTYKLVDQMVDCMPNIVMDGIRTGNGFLLINDAVDGIFYHMMNRLVADLDKHNIPRHKVIYVSGNIDIDDVDNLWGVHIVRPDWNEIVVSTQVNEFASIPANSLPKLNKFLSLNRMWHHHRVNLLYQLYRNNLLEHFDISFRKTEPNVGKGYTEKLLEIAPSILPQDQLVNIEQLAEQIDSLLPLVVDDPLAKTLHESHSYELDHTRYYFNIVPETNFYNFNNNTYTGVHASEKIFKPILYRTPFIVIGPAGLLKALQKKGYKTFNNIIDESYDSIINDQHRFDAIINLIKQLSKLSIAELESINVQAREVCEYNLKRLGQRGAMARQDFIQQLEKIVYNEDIDDRLW